MLEDLAYLEEKEPEVGCALPDLPYALALALGVVVIVAALAIVLIGKMRLW